MKESFLLVPIWVVATAASGFAQGAYVTTVTNFVVSPLGHQESNINVMQSEQSSENNFSISTDTKSGSNTTKRKKNGVTTTEVYNYGSNVTNITREQGRYSKTESFEYSESFDYADFVNVNSVTTGYRGEKGPKYK